MYRSGTEKRRAHRRVLRLDQQLQRRDLQRVLLLISRADRRCLIGVLAHAVAQILRPPDQHALIAGFRRADQDPPQDEPGERQHDDRDAVVD